MTIVDELRTNRESGAKRLETEYKGGLMTLARRLCGDEGDAEELVNRTFAAVVDGIDDYLEQSAFFGWMCKILANLHSKDVRRKMNGLADSAGDISDIPDAGDYRIFMEVDAGILRDAIEGLPPEMRDAMMLRYFMGMPLAKVAKILAVPVGTVNSRLHYARMLLAAKLGAATRKTGVKAAFAAFAIAAVAALGAAALAVGRGGAARGTSAATGPAAVLEAVEAAAEPSISPSKASRPVPRLDFASFSDGASEAGAAIAADVSDLTQDQTTMTPMKNTPLLTAALGLALAASAPAATTTITDTTGYVVQNATDAWGQSSPFLGSHFPGGVPVPGKQYLVNNAYVSRTPESGAPFTFAGDSLTLDGGAQLVLKCNGSVTTIADLRIYNGGLSQGDAGGTKTLRGGVAVFGTPAAPSFFNGSGGRTMVVDSKISGPAGSRAKVGRSGTEAVSHGNEFLAAFSGDNSGFAGSWEVETAGVLLAATSANALGKNPDVTLSSGGALAGRRLSLSGAKITVNGNGRLGAYDTGSGTAALTLTGGSTVSGSGTLLVRSSVGSTRYWGQVVLDDVAISGISGISVADGVLALGASYDNPAIPIDITGSVEFPVKAKNAGPVTLQRSAYLNTAGASPTFASLDVQGSAYIRKQLSQGLVTIVGNIENHTDGGKIRIDFSDTSITRLSASRSYRVLSAANLGSGVDASAFEATADGASEFVREALRGGTFSVETEGGVKYLVYTLAKSVVWTTASDGSGNAFTAGTIWSDKAVPHADAAYYVTAGNLARAVNLADCTFPGGSLTILENGSFAVQGATATIADMHLFGGAIVSPTRPLNNVLAGGKVTVYGTAAKPVLFRTEVPKNKDGRECEIRSDVSGSGSVKIEYFPSSAAAIDTAYPKGIFRFTGDNSGFSGEWQLAHWNVRTSFADADSIGSAAKIHFISNGVFWAESSYDIPASVAVAVDAAGSVSGNLDRTNGGSFEVEAGQTLSVAGTISGAGILRKTGAGTLRISGENSLVGGVSLEAGTLAVASSGATGGSAISVKSADAVLRIESADGLRIDEAVPLALASGVSALKVQPSAFDSISESAGAVSQVLFVLPNASAFDTSLVEIERPRGHSLSVEASIRAADGLLEVRASASPRGLTLIIR